MRELEFKKTTIMYQTYYKAIGFDCVVFIFQTPNNAWCTEANEDYDGVKIIGSHKTYEEAVAEAQKWHLRRLTDAQKKLSKWEDVRR